MLVHMYKQVIKNISRKYVTQFEKADLMAQFAQIELLVPLECAFNCTSIGAIDAVIGCSVAKL